MIRYPSKHDTSTQCWTYVDPPSTTSVQHWSNIGSMCRFSWVCGILPRLYIPTDRFDTELYSRCPSAILQIADVHFIIGIYSGIQGRTADDSRTRSLTCGSRTASHLRPTYLIKHARCVHAHGLIAE